MARNCTGPCPSTGAVVKLYSALKLLAYMNNTEREQLVTVMGTFGAQTGRAGAPACPWGCCDIACRTWMGWGWGGVGWAGLGWGGLGWGGAGRGCRGLWQLCSALSVCACLLHFDRFAVQHSRTVAATGIAEGASCLISYTQGASYMHTQDTPPH